MLHIGNSNVYWYLGVFLICLLTTGLINNFNFLTEQDINLHDSYVSVATWQLAIISFIITEFIVFAFLTFKSRFQNRGTMLILLIHNTLIICSTIYVLYVIYVVMTADALVELFRTNKSEHLMIENLKGVLIAFTFILLPFLIVEILLIRRVRGLNTLKKAYNKL
ncbi:hypothetical protein PEDI_32120 [Persicobacter diffluens]|uniref:Uncharacterized protein n=1 Tax=Persicobacter diffluens TaxID=981 RepID=A0AAN4W2B5_9BACT|nr:hypothetical protein PEDI_32120 [Persicobacter diffluens]